MQFEDTAIDAFGKRAKLIERLELFEDFNWDGIAEATKAERPHPALPDGALSNQSRRALSRG